MAQAGQEHAIGSVQCLASPRALSYCESYLFNSFILLWLRPTEFTFLKTSPQTFAEAINLKENLKKIGVFPQPKKTKEQVEAEREVKHKK